MRWRAPWAKPVELAHCTRCPDRVVASTRDHLGRCRPCSALGEAEGACFARLEAELDAREVPVLFDVERIAAGDAARRRELEAILEPDALEAIDAVEARLDAEALGLEASTVNREPVDVAASIRAGFHAVEEQLDEGLEARFDTRPLLREEDEPHA